MRDNTRNTIQIAVHLGKYILAIPSVEGLAVEAPYVVSQSVQQQVSAAVHFQGHDRKVHVAARKATRAVLAAVCC